MKERIEQENSFTEMIYLRKNTPSLCGQNVDAIYYCETKQRKWAAARSMKYTKSNAVMLQNKQQPGIGRRHLKVG